MKKLLCEIKTPESIIKKIRTMKLNSYKSEYTNHREIWEKHFGKIPKGMMIHHINKNKRDNRIKNLELVDRKEHGQKHLLPNRIRIKYTSGIKVIKTKYEKY